MTAALRGDVCSDWKDFAGQKHLTACPQDVRAKTHLTYPQGERNLEY